MNHIQIRYLTDPSPGWYWNEEPRKEGEWYQPTMTEPLGPFNSEQEAMENAESWLDQ